MGSTFKGREEEEGERIRRREEEGERR